MNKSLHCRHVYTCSLYCKCVVPHGGIIMPLPLSLQYRRISTLQLLQKGTGINRGRGGGEESNVSTQIVKYSSQSNDTALPSHQHQACTSTHLFPPTTHSALAATGWVQPQALQGQLRRDRCEGKQEEEKLVSYYYHAPRTAVFPLTESKSDVSNVCLLFVIFTWSHFHVQRGLSQCVNMTTSIYSATQNSLCNDTFVVIFFVTLFSFFFYISITVTLLSFTF